MGEVEVGVASAGPKIPNVANKPANNRVADRGDVVDRMAKRVIELELQSARVSFRQRNQHGVIV